MGQTAHRAPRTADELRKAGPRAGADQDEAALVAGGAAAEVFAGQTQAPLEGSLVCRRSREWRESEVCSTAVEVVLLMAIGERSAVADTDETVGQDVEEESADELVGMEALGTPASAPAIVFVSEEDVLALPSNESLFEMATRWV